MADQQHKHECECGKVAYCFTSGCNQSIETLCTPCRDWYVERLTWGETTPQERVRYERKLADGSQMRAREASVEYQRANAEYREETLSDLMGDIS